MSVELGVRGGTFSEGSGWSSESSVGGCFRFRDLSFARRALRSVAAASRVVWVEAMFLNTGHVPGFLLAEQKVVFGFGN